MDAYTLKLKREMIRMKAREASMIAIPIGWFMAWVTLTALLSATCLGIGLGRIIGSLT